VCVCVRACVRACECVCVSFLAVGGVVQVACQGFLVKEACVGVLVGGAGLVVLNSLSFCLSVKLLISPSYLNEILAGYSNLSYWLFSFITLIMSCHSLLA